MVGETHDRDMTTFYVGEYLVLLTGGLSWGDSPTELSDIIWSFERLPFIKAYGLMQKVWAMKKCPACKRGMMNDENRETAFGCMILLAAIMFGMLWGAAFMFIVIKFGVG